MQPFKHIGVQVRYSAAGLTRYAKCIASTADHTVIDVTHTLAGEAGLRVNGRNEIELRGAGMSPVDQITEALRHRGVTPPPMTLI